MSGQYSGVQTRIREKAPAAVYVHCFAHKLNLALVDTCHHEREATLFLALLQSLYTFLSSSIPHAMFREVQLMLHPSGPVRELKRLSDTRWFMSGPLQSRL
jgi:hypothetical protein